MISQVENRDQIIDDSQTKERQTKEGQFFSTEPYEVDRNDSVIEFQNVQNRANFPKTVFVANTSHKFEPMMKDSESNKVLSCRFDRSGQSVASGCEDGVIRIVSNQTDSIAYTLVDVTERASPVTCVRWRPVNPQDNIQNTLLATYSNGCILYWHSTSNQILVRIKEEDNPINSCDYSCDGLRFVTAGQDTKVRLYDAGRARPIATHSVAGTDAPKHSNRIFALKCNEKEPFILYSAGWDNMVLIWDLRVGKAQQYIYGPLVCGDALDQHENQLLTGSWRDDNQIEIWDLRKLSKVVGIKWDDFTIPNIDPSIALHFRQRSSIYSACFDQVGKNVYAGSAGTQYSEIRMFDPEDNYKCQDSYSALSRGVLSMDCTGKSDQKLAYGVADGTQGILDLYL